MTLAPKGKGGCDSSRNHAGNGLPNLSADRRRETDRADMGPREGRRVRCSSSVIKKDGNKTSEKRWVCKFCESPFQPWRHGTGKKKAS